MRQSDRREFIKKGSDDMKAMKPLVLLLTMLLSLSLYGCSIADRAVLDTAPYALRYVSCAYNLSTDYHGNRPFQLQNFTKTDNLMIDAEETDFGAQYAAGWTVLTSATDLRQFFSLEQEWKELQRVYWSESISEEQYESRYGGEPLLLVDEGSDDSILDDAFFDDNDLLLIDLCFGGALELTLTPDAFTVAENRVALSVSFCCRLSSTTDNHGAILLIVIPKGCAVDSRHITLSPDSIEVGNPLG